MDLIDLVNDLIDKRKSEINPVHTDGKPMISTNNPNLVSDETTKIENKYLLIKENIEYYVELLNQGVDPTKIEKHFNLPYGKLEELLLSKNYKFYSFMNYWSVLDEEQLCHDLVSQLNSGNTIYDLSGKYLRGNKERLRFVSMVEKLLDKYHCQYNHPLKMWEFAADSNNRKGLPLIVEKLNSGKPLKEVASQFEVTPASLRLSLKNANYRYDSLFNVWTVKDRKELVDQLALDLKNGIITIEELKEKDFDSKILETLNYLSEHKQVTPQERRESINSTNLEMRNNLNNEETSQDREKIEISNAQFIEREAPLTLSQTHSVKEEKPSTEKNSEHLEGLIFTNHEINVLKDMINFWSEELHSESTMKALNIFINSSILSELEIYSEKQGLSKSKVIENALLKYLND